MVPGEAGGAGEGEQSAGWERERELLRAQAQLEVTGACETKDQDRVSELQGVNVGGDGASGLIFVEGHAVRGKDTERHTWQTPLRHGLDLLPATVVPAEARDAGALAAAKRECVQVSADVSEERGFFERGDEGGGEGSAEI